MTMSKRPLTSKQIAIKSWREALSIRPRLQAMTFAGALVAVAAVHVFQVGSIEGAVGSFGRILAHSLSADENCGAVHGERVGESPFVRSGWAAYEATLARLVASGVPRNKQPGELSAQLLRGGGDNALQALGGRVPPERALQLVGLTVPLRFSGPAESVVLEPGATGIRFCE